MIYPLNISTDDDLKAICSRIGTDPRALAYLIPKSRMLHFFADNVDFRAAGFLKQEMLSRGGDTIVTKHVIDAKAEHSDILIMGTPSQIESLIRKMGSMDCWGLKELRAGLTNAYMNMKTHEWTLSSPNGHTIELGDDTRLMGIMNLTPDSFHDASRVTERDVLGRAEELLTQGAYILDLGAESTRPGAVRVSQDDELERLIPALRMIRSRFTDAIISVDTYKPEVARIAVSEGADIINDISGFEFGEGMPEIIASLNVPYVLSHTKGTPDVMAVHEGSSVNIVQELVSWFAAKLESLSDAGVALENVILDPGLGFGKSAGESFALVKDIESMKIFGRPVIIGHSRKRFTGGLEGTLAVTAMLGGRVSLLRVHDVHENMQALRVASAVLGA